MTPTKRGARQRCNQCGLGKCHLHIGRTKAAFSNSPGASRIRWCCVRHRGKIQTNAMDWEPVPIDLALQGDGSHGAFTSGALDRLPVTNHDFRKFVNATGHVTDAEIPPDPKDCPGALPHMLKAGGSHLCAPNYCRRHPEPVNTSMSRQSLPPQQRGGAGERRLPQGPGCEHLYH